MKDLQIDKEKIVHTILSCVQRTDGQATRRDLLKILHGENSKKLAKFHFDHLNEFASLKTINRNEILKYIDEMIERGLISVSIIGFPALQLTDIGRKRLNERL